MQESSILIREKRSYHLFGFFLIVPTDTFGSAVQSSTASLVSHDSDPALRRSTPSLRLEVLFFQTGSQKQCDSLEKSRKFFRSPFLHIILFSQCIFLHLLSTTVQIKTYKFSSFPDAEGNATGSRSLRWILRTDITSHIAVRPLEATTSESSTCRYGHPWDPCLRPVCFVFTPANVAAAPSLRNRLENNWNCVLATKYIR